MLSGDRWTPDAELSGHSQPAVGHLPDAGFPAVRICSCQQPSHQRPPHPSIWHRLSCLMSDSDNARHLKPLKLFHSVPKASTCLTSPFAFHLAWRKPHKSQTNLGSQTQLKMPEVCVEGLRHQRRCRECGAVGAVWGILCSFLCSCGFGHGSFR